MQFHQTCRVPLPREKAWDFVMNVKEIATCIPGVEKVEPVGENEYLGTMKIRVGPIGLSLDGKMTIVEQDKEHYRAVMSGQGADKKVGGAVNVKMTMALNEVSANESELVIDTDASIMGRLGEFGQAVMRKKADSMMSEFAKNLTNKAKTGATA